MKQVLFKKTGKTKLFILLFMGTIHLTNLQAQHPDLLFMIEHAIQAPSGHNSQPWLFKMGENRIEIHPDYENALPVVDTDHRELFISLGCALENLCIAASEKGYGQEVSISERGIITVQLLPGGNSWSDSRLITQIPLRQTNRSIYNGRQVPEETVAELRKCTNRENVQIHFYENGSDGFKRIQAFIEEGNRQQMRDKEFKQELKEWMRFNKKHSEEKNDGLSYEVFGAPNLPSFISKPIISVAINERSQVKGDHKKIDSSSHLVLFTIRQNSLSEWIELGRVLQQFLLKSTEMGIVHSYFNQPNEIRDLSVRMAESLRLKEEYPSLLLRIGYGEPMPYSKRRGIEEVLLGQGS